MIDEVKALYHPMSACLCPWLKLTSANFKAAFIYDTCRIQIALLIAGYCSVLRVGQSCRGSRALRVTEGFSSFRWFWKGVSNALEECLLPSKWFDLLQMRKMKKRKASGEKRWAERESVEHRIFPLILIIAVPLSLLLRRSGHSPQGLLPLLYCCVTALSS